MTSKDRHKIITQAILRGINLNTKVWDRDLSIKLLQDRCGYKKDDASCLIDMTLEGELFSRSEEETLVLTGGAVTVSNIYAIITALRDFGVNEHRAESVLAGPFPQTLFKAESGIVRKAQEKLTSLGFAVEVKFEVD